MINKTILLLFIPLIFGDEHLYENLEFGDNFQGIHFEEVGKVTFKGNQVMASTVIDLDKIYFDLQKVMKNQSDFIIQYCYNNEKCKSEFNIIQCKRESADGIYKRLYEYLTYFDSADFHNYSAAVDNNLKDSEWILESFTRRQSDTFKDIKDFIKTFGDSKPNAYFDAIYPWINCTKQIMEQHIEISEYIYTVIKSTLENTISPTLFSPYRLGLLEKGLLYDREQFNPVALLDPYSATNQNLLKGRVDYVHPKLILQFRIDLYETNLFKLFQLYPMYSNIYGHLVAGIMPRKEFMIYHDNGTYALISREELGTCYDNTYCSGNIVTTTEPSCEHSIINSLPLHYHSCSIVFHVTSPSYLTKIENKNKWLYYINPTQNLTINCPTLNKTTTINISGPGLLYLNHQCYAIIKEQKLEPTVLTTYEPNFITSSNITLPIDFTRISTFYQYESEIVYTISTIVITVIIAIIIISIGIIKKNKKISEPNIEPLVSPPVLTFTTYRMPVTIPNNTMVSVQTQTFEPRVHYDVPKIPSIACNNPMYVDMTGRKQNLTPTVFSHRVHQSSNTLQVIDENIYEYIQIN